MSITAFIGIYFAQKKPNEKFPYGYYKLENIISLIISIFIFFTAWTILFESLKNIINFYQGVPRIIQNSPLTTGFLLISLFISILLTMYLQRIGKKTKSPIIISQGREKLYDIFISSSVIFGFVCALFNLYIIDSLISLVIVFFIVKGGYDIFLSATKVLLDAVIDFENRKELHGVIENYPKIEKIDKLEIRSYGRYIFVELDISFDKSFPISRLNTLIENLRTDIIEKFPQIFKIIIVSQSKQDPIIKIAIPLLDNNDLNSLISEHYGESPFFALIDIKEGVLMNLEILTNEFAKEERQKGILVADWLNSKKIDSLYLKKPLNRGPAILYNNNYIDIIITKWDKIEDIIKNEHKT